MKGDMSPIEKSIHRMHTSNKPDVAKHAMRTILKLLRVIIHKPEDKKARMFREDNIIIKKHVSGVAGGSDFMTSLGFVSKEEGGKLYLML